MITLSPSLTNIGQSLMLRALNGEFLTFTGFKIGDGELASGDGSDLTDLISPKLSFPIDSKDTSVAKVVKVTGHFDSADVITDFRCRELGLFCKGETSEKFSTVLNQTTFTISSKPPIVHKVEVAGDVVEISNYDAETGIVTLAEAPEEGTDNVTIYYPDDEEKLYAYLNEGANAGLLKANMSNVVSEQTFSLVVGIGDAENIAVILARSELYPSKEEFDEHVSAHNPHGITKDTLGLGNVLNYAPNDTPVSYSGEAPAIVQLGTTETLSSFLKKVAKAVKVFIEHLSAKNPHNITAETLGITSNVVSGAYTGDGKTYQFIDLGFHPKSVTVCPLYTSADVTNSGTALDEYNSLVSGAGTNHRSPASINIASAYHYVKIAIVGNGFYVCYCSASGHAKTNNSGVAYSYIATK